MEREEKHREKWALGITVSLFVCVMVGFGFYKGFITVSPGAVFTKDDAAKTEVAAVAVSDAPSPIENTKETFEAAFAEINKQYDIFVGTISDVVVPFFTGIEVYERE